MGQSLGKYIDVTMKDFCKSANNHSLTSTGYSKLVLNCFTGEKLELYFGETDHNVSYIAIVGKRCERYNILHRKMALQSEMGSLYFNDFMAPDKTRENKESLRLVEYLNKVTPQLVGRFRTEPNEARNIRKGVL